MFILRVKKSIQGISEKMLIEQLNELLAYNIIGKTVFDRYPLKVAYYLEKRGEKLCEALKIMQEIGLDLLSDSFI